MLVIYIVPSVVWECLMELRKLLLAGRKSYTARGSTSKGTQLKNWRLDKAAKSVIA